MNAFSYMYRPHREQLSTRGFWYVTWARVLNHVPYGTQLLDVCTKMQDVFVFMDTYASADPENLQDDAVRWHLEHAAHILGHVVVSGIADSQIPREFYDIYRDIFVGDSHQLTLSVN